jgi:DNA polymerase-1
VEKDDGIMRAQFNQNATQTHRLSSSGLDYTTQFQNFPRAYKPMFCARREEWLVGECDGAQLEFRVAAHLGRCPVAIRAVEEGQDVHSDTARVLSDSGEPTTRQEAKAHTFKPLYGGNSGTAAQQAYYQWFRDHYTGITVAQNRWIDTVLEYGALKTEAGLTFHYPGTKMLASGYVTNTPSICNYPVQSLATAEIIPIGLVYFWHAVKTRGLQMLVVNTIHDSIIVELPPEEVEVFHELSRYALINVPYWYLRQVYGIEFSAPLGAGVNATPCWSDGSSEETKYNAEESAYRGISERRSSDRDRAEGV